MKIPEQPNGVTRKAEADALIKARAEWRRTHPKTNGREEPCTRAKQSTPITARTTTRK